MCVIFRATRSMREPGAGILLRRPDTGQRPQLPVQLERIMLNLKKVAAAGALLAATCVVPFCEAQSTVNVKVLTAGSSAQWGVFAKAADALASAEMSGVSAGSVHHCTINGAALVDN